MSIAKIEDVNNSASQNDCVFSRTQSAPGILLIDETCTLKERLQCIMQEKKADEEHANAIIERMKLMRKDLNSTLTSCHKTLEVTGAALLEHFKKCPPKKLAAEIKERFEHFDKDKSGFLDRDEVREAMAEMGSRPTDEELEEFYTECDMDGNGLIDLVKMCLRFEIVMGVRSRSHFE